MLISGVMRVPSFHGYLKIKNRNGVVDTVTVEFNLGFKIGQDDHSCKGAIGTETWTCGKGDK
jgi:hypothetical protein